MVVPHNDPNKVRVKGYHIIGVVSKEAMAVLKQNKPMTGDEEALTMVFDAIHGNHIDRIERVQVNGQYGTNVVMTKLKHDSRRGRNAYSHTGTDLHKAAALDDDTNITGSVDPREINKRVTAEHEKEEREKKALVPEPEKEAPQIFPSTNKALAREMFVAGRFEELWLFKRTKKKSWSVLGFTDNEEKKILSKKP